MGKVSEQVINLENEVIILRNEVQRLKNLIYEAGLEVAVVPVKKTLSSEKPRFTFTGFKTMDDPGQPS